MNQQVNVCSDFSETPDHSWHPVGESYSTEDDLRFHLPLRYFLSHQIRVVAEMNARFSIAAIGSP